MVREIESDLGGYRMLSRIQRELLFRTVIGDEPEAAAARG
jgi:hypothetical protein